MPRQAPPSQAEPRPAVPGPAMPRRVMPSPAETLTLYLGCFLGRFQYGLLHFGQIVGVTVSTRGTHLCPQRSHRHASSLIFATGRECLIAGYS